MNILVLHSELGVLWGGGETFTTSLFTAFAERGHRITAAFVADRHGRYPRTLPTSFEPMPIPGRWSRKLGQAALSAVGSRLPAPIRPAWDRLQEALCWRTIRWHNRRFERRIERTFAAQWKNFDAVYVNGNVGLAHKAAFQRPTLLMLPGPISEDLAPLLTNVQAVCAHDDGLTAIRAFLGDKATELPLGLDSRTFYPAATPIRRELGWSDTDIVIGFVGRLALIKGVDLLAAAFHEIAQRLPNAKLLMVGGGEEEGRLRTVLASELRDGRVHFQRSIGQDQLPPWYRAMDLFVMPSRYETLSNAVLEAMACGVPFAASRVGGSKNLEKTGAGWLFDPESVASLADLLGRISQDAAKLKGRGQFGASYVRDHYSWVASAERLEQIMVSCLGVTS